MKKLSRPEGPLCLNNYKHGRDNWNIISQNKLTGSIWDKLNLMQKGFCAYCECQLIEDNHKRHIEHFIQKGKNPAVTFDWNNLFGSCNNKNRCGRYKDQNYKAKNIDTKLICKPDVLNPSDYIIFLTSGFVKKRNNLSEGSASIADNTINIFNLNGDTSLVNSRSSTIKSELPLIIEYWNMCSKNQDVDIQELLDNELQESLKRISDYEYATALHHSWIYTKGY